MEINNITSIAENAANIENSLWGDGGFGYDVNKDSDGTPVHQNIINCDNGKQYEVLDTLVYSNPDFPESENEKYKDYYKAVVIRDKETNEIYFHFNGTGDGNWVYNAAAYGAEPQPSEMQKTCADWFDKMYVKHCTSGDEKIYVTGHSQGGNNAMYVTMRAKNANKIDLCVPLDGPGFSDKFVSDTKELLGEDYYKQSGKIWAYNGEYDYVSPLGQNSIVPEGHTRYIKYSGDPADFGNFHGAGGLIDPDGRFLEVLNSDSEFRKRLASAVEKIKDLPPEDQALAAKVIMQICENSIGDRDKEPRTADISAEDFEKIKPSLVPVLVELLAYNPDGLSETLQYVLGLDPESAEAIANLIKKINSYPLEYREDIISGILDMVKIENNEFKVDTSTLIEELIIASPMLLESLLTNPNDIGILIKKFGLEKILDLIKENPWKASGAIVVAAIIISNPILSGLAVAVVKGVFWGVAFIDVAIRIYQFVEGIAEDIVNAIVDLFESVKDVINKIGDWLHDQFNKGDEYVKEHPYFKADTDKLDNYSTRLWSVNQRLKSLDSGLRSLYWQVGFLDLWDILCSNIITSESYSLNRARSYLMTTSEKLIKADNTAKRNLEG